MDSRLLWYPAAAARRPCTGGTRRRDSLGARDIGGPAGYRAPFLLPTSRCHSSAPSSTRDAATSTRGARVARLPRHDPARNVGRTGGAVTVAAHPTATIAPLWAVVHRPAQGRPWERPPPQAARLTLALRSGLHGDLSVEYFLEVRPKARSGHLLM